MMRNDIRQLTEELKGKIEVQSFIEIGSRDGHDTNYISHYWNVDPSKCYIIEAHPDCYQYIINMYPQFNTLNVAASNKTEVVTFNAGIIGVENNIGRSSVLEYTKGEFINKLVEVDAWKIVDVMNHFNIDTIDLAKVDVEGFTLQVLEGFEEKLVGFKAIQMELESAEVWKGQSLYDDVVTFMKHNNFYVVDDIDLDGIQRDVLFVK